MSTPKNLFVFIFSLFSIVCYGQMDQPVKWYFKAKSMDDGTYEVIATAKIMDGWYIYSKSATAKSGLQPTQVDLTSKAVDLVGNVQESGKKIESIQPETNLKVTKLKSMARYTQRIRLKDDLADLEGVVSFMTCTDSQCLPPQEIPFSIALQ